MATRKTVVENPSPPGLRQRPAKCRRCRRPNTEVRVSFRGLCSDCAFAAVERNARDLAEKRGPGYERWLQAMERVTKEARGA